MLIHLSVLEFPVLDGVLHLLCIWLQSVQPLCVYIVDFFTCLWNNLEGFSAFCVAACFFCMKLVNTGTTLLESEVETLQYFCLNFWWILLQWQHPFPPTPKPKFGIYMAWRKCYQQWLSGRCRCLLTSNSVHSLYCIHYVFSPSKSHSRWLFCIKGKDYSKLNKISEVYTCAQRWKEICLKKRNEGENEVLVVPAVCQLGGVA